MKDLTNKLAVVMHFSDRQNWVYFVCQCSRLIAAATADLFEDQTCWACLHPGDSVSAVVEGAGVVSFGVNAVVLRSAEVVASWTRRGAGWRWVHGGLGGKRRKVWNNNSNILTSRIISVFVGYSSHLT